MDELFGIHGSHLLLAKFFENIVDDFDPSGRELRSASGQGHTAVSVTGCSRQGEPKSHLASFDMLLVLASLVNGLHRGKTAVSSEERIQGQCKLTAGRLTTEYAFSLELSRIKSRILWT